MSDDEIDSDCMMFTQTGQISTEHRKYEFVKKVSNEEEGKIF